MIYTSFFGQPAISSFAPLSGPIGATVIIKGTNFNLIPANNIVFFGATKATVYYASNDSLTVTVPLGATYENISVTNLANHLTAYSTQPFIVTFPCGGGFDAGNFAPKVSFDCGGTNNYYSSISPSDFDGDGKADLAITIPDGDIVSILKNTSTSGAVAFTPYISFTSYAQPTGSTIGDFDGDGKQDLAVTNYSTNNGTYSFSVFENTSTSGVISFAEKIVFETGPYPYSISKADFDGDGKPDLALTIQSSGQGAINLYTNNSTTGTISFSINTGAVTGIDPFSIATGDLNGDMKPDIIVANFGSNTISIFQNTSTIGNISFAAKTDYSTGFAPLSVAAGDLDGDGKLDIVTANKGSATLSVFQNTSNNGIVSFASKLDYITGAEPNSIAIADLDGDGKSDIATGNSYNGLGGNSVSVFENTSTNGIISFSTKTDYTIGTAPKSIASGDMDGDGKSDLIISIGGGTSSVYVLRNKCIPSGIVSHSELSTAFRIYPNPFTTQTTISIDKELKNANYKIIDVLGKEVKAANFSDRQTIIEKGELNQGIYLIQVFSKNEMVASGKIIIE